MIDKLTEAMARAIHPIMGWFGSYGMSDYSTAMSIKQAQAARQAIEAEGYEIRQGWQPIETAPKDGTVILLSLKGKRPFTAYFAQAKDDNGNVDCWVTHSNWSHSYEEYQTVNVFNCMWQPLPEPPVQAAQEKDGEDEIAVK